MKYNIDHSEYRTFLTQNRENIGIFLHKNLGMILKQDSSHVTSLKGLVSKSW